MILWNSVKLLNRPSSESLVFLRCLAWIVGNSFQGREEEEEEEGHGTFRELDSRLLLEEIVAIAKQAFHRRSTCSLTKVLIAYLLA
jgi:hypothetical protein